MNALIVGKALLFSSLNNNSLDRILLIAILKSMLFSKLLFEVSFQLYDNTQVQYEEGTYYFDDNLDGLDDYNMSNPDFSVVQFNSNLVLRWEYIPGSELFLVWSQGIRTDVSLENGLIEGAQNGILEHQPQNIFLIKATYRFNL